MFKTTFFHQSHNVDHFFRPFEERIEASTQFEPKLTNFKVFGPNALKAASSEMKLRFLKILAKIKNISSILTDELTAVPFLNLDLGLTHVLLAGRIERYE